MRILVLWRRENLKVRKTIVDHAFSLKRYDTKNEYFYFDIEYGKNYSDYKWIKAEMFDAVIFHYSAVALRHADSRWNNFLKIMIRVWCNYPCKKILITQDDYTLTERIWDLATGIKADRIYTVMRECDYPILYPSSKVGGIVIKTILTGYVEKSYLDVVRHVPYRQRRFDVTYRARKLPYEFGKHGQLKYELLLLFKEKLEATMLEVDIGNTEGDKGAILGNDWFTFLGNSRVTIGCLGGAGFADFKGTIRDKVRAYMEKNPDASFEQASKNCFPEIIDNLTGVISPRIFECALMKTCQVLVGEDYQDILRPDIDYIVLKEDFSNVDEVIEKISDRDYCEKIAENCFESVVASGKYTYEAFVRKICKEMYIGINAKEENLALSAKIERICAVHNEKVIKRL